MQVYEKVKAFDGTIYRVRHDSKELKCSMRLNVFVPNTGNDEKIPVLLFLSGLTCTPDNALEKGFLTAAAAEHKLAVVFPDTSPREVSVDGEDEDWDFGSGAGFYLNATQSPWSEHYRMEAYIIKEVVGEVIPSLAMLDGSRIGLAGHSMGGHGALTLFLRNPTVFKSLSALAPISNPINAPWGKKAFTGYLGPVETNASAWKEHDATELVKTYNGPVTDILIDYGTEDKFYKDGQLLPENFEKAVENSKLKGRLNLRAQPGYDHGYFFISTFSADHVAHHSKALHHQK